MAKYTLSEVNDIIADGFDAIVPDDVMEKISQLALLVGAPDYVKTPVFKKKEIPVMSTKGKGKKLRTTEIVNVAVFPVPDCACATTSRPIIIGFMAFC